MNEASELELVVEREVNEANELELVEEQEVNEANKLELVVKQEVNEANELELVNVGTLSTKVIRNVIGGLTPDSGMVDFTAVGTPLGWIIIGFLISEC
jgi:hypothetical protein